MVLIVVPRNKYVFYFYFGHDARCDVPFVVQVTPRFLSRREFEYNTSHGPDVHRTVSATGIVLDDFRRHVHGGARQPAAQGNPKTAPEKAFCRTTGTHHRTVVPRKNLCCPKVDELYHT